MHYLISYIQHTVAYTTLSIYITDTGYKLPIQLMHKVYILHSGVNASQKLTNKKTNTNTKQKIKNNNNNKKRKIKKTIVHCDKDSKGRYDRE